MNTPRRDVLTREQFGSKYWRRAHRFVVAQRPSLLTSKMLPSEVDVVLDRWYADALERLAEKEARAARRAPRATMESVHYTEFKAGDVVHTGVGAGTYRLVVAAADEANGQPYVRTLTLRRERAKKGDRFTPGTSGARHFRWLGDGIGRRVVMEPSRAKATARALMLAKGATPEDAKEFRRVGPLVAIRAAELAALREARA